MSVKSFEVSEPDAPVIPTRHARLRHLRERLGLSQEQLGQGIGVAPSMMAEMESGATTIPRPVTLALCHRYSVREEWLDSGSGRVFEVSPRMGLFAYDPETQEFLRQGDLCCPGIQADRQHRAFVYRGEPCYALFQPGDILVVGNTPESYTYEGMIHNLVHDGCGQLYIRQRVPRRNPLLTAQPPSPIVAEMELTVIGCIEYLLRLNNLTQV